MARVLAAATVLLFFALPLMGQGVRVWVLRAPGEMVEYDVTTFALKQTVKVPTEAVQSPQSFSVNHLGQMLFAPTVSLPLSESDADAPRKIWFWNGQTATMLDRGVTRKSVEEGSNLAINESAPTAYLSVDGKHLFWFANQAHRLQRDDVDLTTATTWQGWRTDLSGGAREEVASSKFPECKCTTGTCEETCPYRGDLVPANGVGTFFLTTESVAGQTQTDYKASTRYPEDGGKWTAKPLTPPLRNILDAAADGNVIVEAIPDVGCCGWVNQSNDQTLLRSGDKTIPIFDELAAYKNPDYDVSFYTSTARLSPSLASVAMTIAATAQPNQPIQLAEEGQANPEELQRIRKALADLPAVEVKSVEDSPRRVAYVPHAALVGWISEKQILIVEGHVLVAYTVGTGARRKSSIRVEDAAYVFLR
jgi:hypothetical protein